ncbi:MAG: ABC transporter permease subunit [Coriobacteriales bacterium]|jgi:polar amino acid transport system substrate-binding protein|nr:ABC transporter permease subunit [Coriobacteriales bacterium]
MTRVGKGIAALLVAVLVLVALGVLIDQSEQPLAFRLEQVFVTEDRWLMIVSGLLVTLQITIASVIFGTALGFGLYFMAQSRRRVLRLFAKLISRVMHGLPDVVVLLAATYIVFRSLEVSNLAVATIVFALLFAVSVSHTLKIGISAVEEGQTEAAAALGFETRERFLLIILPQATRNVMGLYIGQIISLLKATAIVGYIAVDDLTRVGDIIRGHTFDAFLPLFVTAAIYFLLSALLILLLRVIQKRLNPRPAQRRVRGVVLQGPGGHQPVRSFASFLSGRR